jgi:Domain of unknown function (DUF4383)
MPSTTSPRRAISSARRIALAPPRLRGRTAAQWFCLVVGVLLALRGLQQLASGAGFATPGEGWRATQQLLTAALLLLGQRSETGARWVLVPFALFYAVMAVVGNLNGHEAFGLFPVDGRDKIIHPLYAALALLLLASGWRRSPRDHREAERSARAGG